MGNSPMLVKTAAPAKADGRITWCGPYALATITGVDYLTAYKRLLKRYNYKRRWKVKYLQGVPKWLMTECLKSMLGRKVAWRKLGGSTWKLRENLKPNRLYLVNVTSHYIVVDTHDWTFCDTWSKGLWLPLSDCRNKMVERVMEVRKLT